MLRPGCLDLAGWDLGAPDSNLPTQTPVWGTSSGLNARPGEWGQAAARVTEAPCIKAPVGKAAQEEGTLWSLGDATWQNTRR